MEIPAYFTSYDDGNMIVSDGSFSILSVREGGSSYPLNEKIPQSISKEQRSPVVIIDYNSLIKREFSEKVMKHLRVPGASIWFMTYIETVEDVFDAFNKDAELVLAPYHYIASEAELRDICDVSDSVVPVIFIHKGKAMVGGRQTEDVLKVLEKLVGIGFYRNFVLDMEGSLDGYTWSVIAEDYPSTIPFVQSGDRVAGFQNVIVPSLL